MQATTVYHNPACHFKLGRPHIQYVKRPDFKLGKSALCIKEDSIKSVKVQEQT